MGVLKGCVDMLAEMLGVNAYDLYQMLDEHCLAVVDDNTKQKINVREE